MAKTDTKPQPKLVDFQLVKAFVLIDDQGGAQMIAINPTDSQVIELCKHWQKQIGEGIAA